MHALLLLHLMWRANILEPGKRKIALTEFYNAQLSDHMDVQAEYIAWRQLRVRAPAAGPSCGLGLAASGPLLMPPFSVSCLSVQQL